MLGSSGKLHGLLRLIILLLAAIGFFHIIEQIIFYHPNWEIYVPETIRKTLFSLTTPWPFTTLSEFFDQNFPRLGLINNIYVAASETIRYQGSFLFILFILKRTGISRNLSLIFSLTAFLLSCALFGSIHYGILLPLAGGLALNLLVWYYRSLFPPFLLHLLWNIIHPLVSSW